MRPNGDEELDKMHPEAKGYHGPYKYKDKDKDSIDLVGKFMLADMKSFKGAKDTSTEWLTKKNPVNEKVNEWYHPHKGQEEI